MVARSCLGGEVTGYRSAQELSFEVFEWSHTWVSSSDLDVYRSNHHVEIELRVSFFLFQINVRTLLALTNVCAPRDSLTIQ